MIVKILLPADWWESIIEYGGYYENPDCLEVIFRTRFIPRIKEMVYDYKSGLVNWAMAYCSSTLARRYCYLPYNFIVEIEELLSENDLLIEFEELEKLLSYNLLLTILEHLVDYAKGPLTETNDG